MSTINKNKQWSRKDKKTLTEAVEAGKSAKQVARLLGRTIPSVWSQKWLMAKDGKIATTRIGTGAPKKTSTWNSYSHISLAGRKNIANEYNAGKGGSLKDMSDKYNIHAKTISRWSIKYRGDAPSKQPAQLVKRKYTKRNVTGKMIQVAIPSKRTNTNFQHLDAVAVIVKKHGLIAKVGVDGSIVLSH